MTDSDADLLRQFNADHSQDAFSALVQRHVNLVYSTALRHVHSPQLAEDIAQSVFIDLARVAARLKPDTILSAWLYQVARRTAIDVVRRESRREARERVAVEIAAMNAPAPEWTQIEPLLDDAMDTLDDTDRAAVLLRYFENKSLRQVGDALGTSDDAAQKRVSRSVERLREFFTKRGVTVGTSAVASVISAQAIQAAPPNLAATISAAAFAASAVATGTTSTATLATTKAIAMTTLQKTVVAVAFTAAVGAGVFEAHQASTLRDRVQALQQDQTPLNARIQSLQRDIDSSASNVSALREENERLKQNTAELLQMRNMAGAARRATAEAQELRAELARKTTATDTNPVTGAMAEAMKAAIEQQTEGKLSRLTASLHLTPDQVEVARTILMKQAQAMSTGIQQVFSGKYDKDELNKVSKDAGNVDEQIQALLTPEQQANYANYKRDEASYTASQSANAELVQIQSALDLVPDQLDHVYAALYQVSFDQLTAATKPPPMTNQADAMQWTLDQKTKALEPVLTPTQLDKYRQQQATQIKLIKDIMNKMQSGK